MAASRSLLLMRHAKSGWGEADLPDRDRCLTDHGHAEAQRMGGLLKERGLVPDRILVSTAIRAQETVAAVIETSGYDGPVDSTKRLYLAEPRAYFDLFTEVKAGTARLLVIAHNPGIADLVEMMTRKHVEMCTAGVAHVSCPEDEIAQISSSTRSDMIGFFRPEADFGASEGR